jgi:hypothetical protein
VFLVHERFFDSDQAVIGLMAKHLSEFRAFPLFFYGQHYMLGVQAWTAVPFFWLGGPTMTMLRVPVEIWNFGIVIGFMVVLTRMGIRPVLSLSRCFRSSRRPPPCRRRCCRRSAQASNRLHTCSRSGRCGRGRWRSARCSASALHREFTAFALPALVVATWPSRREWA